jgi:serine O-acetyltransferase
VLINTEKRIDAALEFVVACLEASPQRKFVDLLRPGKDKTHSAVRESLADSLALFITDLARWEWRPETPGALFERLLLFPNLQVAYFYRLSHALFLRGVRLVPDIIAVLARWMTGVEIYYSAKIGPGLKVIHGLGTVIGANCRIGDNFTIYQGVTIGDKLGEQTGLDQRPEIGNYVIACAGASILGPIRVGDKTVIGANAVVLKSLPGRCIAIGCPASVKVENLSDQRFDVFWNSFRTSSSFGRLRSLSQEVTAASQWETRTR